MGNWTRRQLLASVIGVACSSGAADAQAASDRREKVVTKLLKEMSLEQRVAQLFMFGASDRQMTGWFEGQLQGVQPGGIAFVQSNVGSADQVRAFVRAIHRGNEALPPIVGIDQEGGLVLRLRGDPAPGAMELGRLNGDEARALARDRARFLKSFGFDVNFAPVADVAYLPNSYMFFRSLGSDPHRVAETVTQIVRGSRQIEVMGAVKHFPGHGRTAVDSHLAIPEVELSWRRWKQTDGRPFRAAIQAGVEMVMVGHLRYPQWDHRPMSISPVAVRKLRTCLGFEGVIVTDDLAMGALSGMGSYDVLDRATDAGMDLFLYTASPVSWNQLVGHVVDRVRAGEVSRKRIDDSVRRILRLKVDHFRLPAETRR